MLLLRWLVRKFTYVEGTTVVIQGRMFPIALFMIIQNHREKVNGPKYQISQTVEQLVLA
jgi:hypothetical protein